MLLKNSFFFKILGIGFHLICPALIGVKNVLDTDNQP